VRFSAKGLSVFNPLLFLSARPFLSAQPNSIRSKKSVGHSVKVMLEHYGRFQKSDFDRIAEACERVKQEKGYLWVVKRFILSHFYPKMRVLHRYLQRQPVQRGWHRIRHSTHRQGVESPGMMGKRVQTDFAPFIASPRKQGTIGQ